jgi:hypothetical protein
VAIAVQGGVPAVPPQWRLVEAVASLSWTGWLWEAPELTLVI